MEKTCRRCGETKPISQFYKHKQMGDGYLNICTPCNLTAMKARYEKNMQDPQWLVKERARGRAKMKLALSLGKVRKETKEEALIRLHKQREKHPEKYKARQAVSNALARGSINRHPCAVCGAKAQAHHTDYSKPLEVIWLCPKHHSEQHVKEREALILAKM